MKSMAQLILIWIAAATFCLAACTSPAPVVSSFPTPDIRKLIIDASVEAWLCLIDTDNCSQLPTPEWSVQECKQTENLQCCLVSGTISVKVDFLGYDEALIEELFNRHLSLPEDRQWVVDTNIAITEKILEKLSKSNEVPIELVPILACRQVILDRVKQHFGDTFDQYYQLRTSPSLIPPPAFPIESTLLPAKPTSGINGLDFLRATPTPGIPFKTCYLEIFGLKIPAICLP